jgi:hypothetical protein
MSDPQSWPGIPSATSSQESEDGATPYDWPDGPTIDPSGREVAHANLSARQAKALGLLTSGTYGPRGFTSSESARLQLSLESKLRTLLPGSILFQETWKTKLTPLGVPLLAHTASGRRTPGSDSTGWPTPMVGDSKSARNSTAKRSKIPPTGVHAGNTLTDAASFVPWPTPNARTGGMQSDPQAALQRRAQGHQLNLDDAATLGHPSFYPASMEKRGQLNPAHSRWLMGYPIEWDSCGATAMQSLHRSPRRSSKRTGK